MRRSDSTSFLPYFFPFLLLFLVPPACDDSDGSSADGGSRTDAASDGSSDAPPAAGSCASLTAGSELKGSVTTDATWRGVVAVTGEVTVHAAKITIEAGTTFIMGADASLEFGWNSNMASVFARGTEAAPIRFCGKEARAGYFDKIVVGDKVTSDSVLEHVQVSDGGQTTGAALVINAGVLVKSVQVSRSGADGVHAADFKEGSEKLTVTGAAKIAAVLTNQKAVTRLPLGGSYSSGNGTNAVALRFNDIDVDTTFREPGVPYIQEQTIETRAVKVTFAAGVDYRLAVDQSLVIGWNSNEATILAEGTAEKPVLFGRTSETAGGFASVLLESKVRSDSVLKYVKVKGGGNGKPALDIRAPITVDHLTLEMNQTGLKLEGSGFSTRSTNLTITGTSGGPPATVQPTNAATLPRGGTFTGNMNQWIVIQTGDFLGTGTLPNLGIPYRVEGEFETMGSSVLTIEAGTTFLMAADSNFEFGWNYNMAKVVAVGTAASPIVWKGADDVAGYWNGLIVGPNVQTDSKFDFVEVRNGGKAGSAALTVQSATFDVRNTKFSRSMGWGIKKPAADVITPYSERGNTFEMCAEGNVGNL